MFLNEKSKRNFWVMALFLLALPLFVWSCRGNAGNQAEEQQPEKTEEPATEHPADSEHPSEHPEGSEHPDSE
jgi:hypothetical protein